MAETVGAILVATLSSAGVTGPLGGALASVTIAGVSIQTILGTAAIVGASIGLQAALATRPSVPKPEDGSQAIRQGIPPRVRGYGRNRLAGYYMLFEEYNKNSYDVLAFHSGRIGGVARLYLHDDLVAFDDVGSDRVLSAYMADGRYSPAGNVRVRLGFGNVPGVDPVYFHDGGPPGMFSGATHRGNGVAWASLFCQGENIEAADFTRIYPRGLPVLSVVADCALVWDPRDPLQTREDRTSYQINYNPVLHLLDYLIEPDGGLGLDYATVIEPVLDEWMAEADLCDERVFTANGDTEPRYTSNGWYRFDNDPKDVINSILATCDGWLAESGDGTLALKVGVYREPTVTITQDEIFDFSLSYGQPDEQAVNQIDITYTDPNQNYVQVQLEPLQDAESISASGVIRAQPLDLKWTQTNTQASRLGERAMQRLNPSLTGSFSTNLAGLRAMGERWVRVQYPFVSGLQDDVIEIQSGTKIDLMNGRVTFNFIRISEDDIEAYDPNADEIAQPPVPPFVGEELILKREDGTPYVREDGFALLRE